MTRVHTSAAQEALSGSSSRLAAALTKKLKETHYANNFDGKPYTSNDSDLVNHPSHYTFGRFEVIDVLEDWFSDDPLLWQVVKYLARARHKGNLLQDLEKAQFYLQRRIESEKN
jgi:hypothetical protein